jgi:hypothetical protein
MPRSVYFSHGTRSEHLLHEDIIVESISIYGQNFYYIPRELVAKDEILGEDRLSKFKKAFAIEMYLENAEGFEGQGAFIQRFGGMMMEQSATLTVARRRWEQLVGRFGATTIPSRPNEGDLLYFPLTDGLFEIKFVQHQDPFYQIGKLFVYKLEVELFQYASERMETGVKQIDDFETLKSFSTDVVQNGTIREIRVLTRGAGYSVAPTVTIEAPQAAQSTALATGTIVNGALSSIEVTYGGVEYTSTPTVTISNPDIGSDVATATASISNNKVTSISIVNPGSGYASAPTITIDPPPLYTTAAATAILGDQVGVNDTEVVRIRLDNPGSGYTSPPTVTITGIGVGATAVAYIANLDKQDSFGDNNKFKEEAADILFSEDNPFGEVN